MTRRMWKIAACLLWFGLAAPVGAQTPPNEATQEFSKGLAALSRGALDEATGHFEAVLKLDPNSFEAHNNLAVIYTEQGKYDAALAQMQKVVALQPDYFRGRKNLAELYARLAYQSFVAAAEMAPADEQEAMRARARLIGAPPGSKVPAGAVRAGALEPASAPPAPAAVAAATPAGEAAAPAAAAPAKVAEAPAPTIVPPKPEVNPAGLVSLYGGVPAIALSQNGMRLFRLIGDSIKPAERVPVEKVPKLSETTVLYVAVPGQGKLELVPIERGQKALTISDASSGRGEIVVDAAALAVMQQAVQPYLTPALVADTLAPSVPEIANAKKDAMLVDFRRWQKSWQARDVDGYIGSYVADYNPRGGPGHAKWRDQRAKVFERSGDLTVTLSEPVILEQGEALITLTKQEYKSKLQQSIGVKKITWIPTPQGWRISEEEMLSEKKG